MTIFTQKDKTTGNVQYEDYICDENGSSRSLNPKPMIDFDSTVQKNSDGDPLAVELSVFKSFDLTQYCNKKS